MFRRAEFSYGLDCFLVERFFQLFTENHRVGWNRALLFDYSSVGKYLFIELLRNVSGDNSCFDLALLERLIALSISAAEENVLKKVFGSASAPFADLSKFNSAKRPIGAT